MSSKDGLKASEVAAFVKRGVPVPTMFGTIAKMKHNAALDEYQFVYENGTSSEWMRAKDRVPILSMPQTAPKANCPTCGYVHKPDKACVDVVKSLLRAVIYRSGSQGTCKSCQATVYWFVDRHTHKNMPYDASGEVHWITCPNARQHRTAPGSDQL